MSGARAPPRFKRLCATTMLFKGPKNSVPSKIVGHEPHQRNCTLPSPPLFLILCARGRREAARPRYSYTAPCTHFAKRFFLFFFFPLLLLFPREDTPAQGVRETFERNGVRSYQRWQTCLLFFLDLGWRVKRHVENVALPGVQPASLLTNSFPPRSEISLQDRCITLLSNVSRLYIPDKNLLQEKRKAWS